jgi:hypothetical protein
MAQAGRVCVNRLFNGGEYSAKLWVVVQFECGTRILRVIHGRDARGTPVKLHHYQLGPLDAEFYARMLECFHQVR